LLWTKMVWRVMRYWGVEQAEKSHTPSSVVAENLVKE